MPGVEDIEAVLRSQGELDMGPYILKRLVARGGMGEVYLAYERSLERYVAVKFLSPALSLDEKVRERFVREARFAATLSHPNIIAVYFAGEYGGRPYFVMEYVDGPSLAALVKRGGHIRVDEALDYMRQSVLGLRAAWRRSRIHRDIKPANLLLTPDGVLKITDFGLAKACDTSSDEQLTSTNVILGTPHFMSPEQAQSCKDLDFRTDIYSLGATFYYVLSGTLPFEGDSAMSILLKHISHPLPPLRSRAPGLPQRVCSLIERMMAKNPIERYSSYEELLEHVDSVRRELETVSSETTVVGLEGGGGDSRADTDSPTVVSPAPPSSRSGLSAGVREAISGFLTSCSIRLNPAGILGGWRESRFGSAVAAVLLFFLVLGGYSLLKGPGGRTPPEGGRVARAEGSSGSAPSAPPAPAVSAPAAVGGGTASLGSTRSGTSSRPRELSFWLKKVRKGGASSRSAAQEERLAAAASAASGKSAAGGRRKAAEHAGGKKPRKGGKTGKPAKKVKPVKKATVGKNRRKVAAAASSPASRDGGSGGATKARRNRTAHGTVKKGVPSLELLGLERSYPEASTMRFVVKASMPCKAGLSVDWGEGGGGLMRLSTVMSREHVLDVPLLSTLSAIRVDVVLEADGGRIKVSRSFPSVIEELRSLYDECMARPISSPLVDEVLATVKKEPNPILRKRAVARVLSARSTFVRLRERVDVLERCLAETRLSLQMRILLHQLRAGYYRVASACRAVGALSCVKLPQPIPSELTLSTKPLFPLSGGYPNRKCRKFLFRSSSSGVDFAAYRDRFNMFSAPVLFYDYRRPPRYAMLQVTIDPFPPDTYLSVVLNGNTTLFFFPLPLGEKGLPSRAGGKMVLYHTFPRNFLHAKIGTNDISLYGFDLRNNPLPSSRRLKVRSMFFYFSDVLGIGGVK